MALPIYPYCIKYIYIDIYIYVYTYLCIYQRNGVQNWIPSFVSQIGSEISCYRLDRSELFFFFFMST